MPLYRKKELQKLIPWTEDLPMELVSISEADRLNGSPKVGDMIAFNPKDETDIWLVGEKFFNDNYEEATQKPLHEEILDLLIKRSKMEHEYINPNFLQEINEALDIYFEIEDNDVDKWIRNMWGC